MNEPAQRVNAGQPIALVLLGVVSVPVGGWFRDRDMTAGYVVMSVTAAATLAALAMWVWRHREVREQRWVVAAVVGVVTVAITLAFAQNPPGRNGSLLAYLWLVPFVYLSFSLRQVVGETVIILVCAWTVLVVHGEQAGYGFFDNRTVGDGLFFTVTVVAIGLVVRAGASSLRRSREAAQRHADRAAALAELSANALTDVPIPRLVDDVLSCARTLLGVDGATILEAASGDVPAAWAGGEDLVQVSDLRLTGDVSAHPAFCRADARGYAAVPVVTRAGTWGWLVVVSRSAPLHLDADGRRTVRALAGLIGLVVQRDTALRDLEHQAGHDPLTGLPNRSLFGEQLSSALLRSERSARSVAVLLLDLDEFKIVNDSLGHAAGDALLREVARRLTTAVRSGDSLARLGGDEFTVLLQDLSCPDDAVLVARHLQEAIAVPMVSAGHRFVMSASIGVAFAGPGSQKAPGQMLREADAAMYHAKKRQRGLVEIFDEELQVRVTRRLALEAELRHAVAAGEIGVAYQTIVAPGTGVITGVEALARWTSPTFGPVPPPEFISIADDTGLIDDLTDAVLARAVADAARWCGVVQGFSVAVNITPRQLQSRSVVQRIEAALERADCLPGVLCLEITELALADALDTVLETMAALAGTGVRFALDDFGTGYSSMSRLRELPLSILKVDRCFIEDEGILRAIRSLAENLGLVSLAEGVETPQQRDRVVSLGYQRAQGYLWSRPAGAEEVDRALRRASSAAGR